MFSKVQRDFLFAIHSPNMAYFDETRPYGKGTLVFFTVTNCKTSLLAGVKSKRVAFFNADGFMKWDMVA